MYPLSFLSRTELFASMSEPSWNASHAWTFFQLFHRLYISLLTSCRAKIFKLTAATLHFSPPAVGFLINTRWTWVISERAKLGQSRASDKSVWTAMTAPLIQRSVSCNTQHVTGIPLLWRSSPYWEGLCQVWSDGMDLHAQFFYLRMLHTALLF